MSTAVCSTFLRYTELGDPLQVLAKYTEPIEPPKATEVLLKTLVAPINPADINTIQGMRQNHFRTENTDKYPRYVRTQANMVRNPLCPVFPATNLWPKSWRSAQTSRA